MQSQHMTAQAVDLNERWWYRLGGVAAIVFGIAYIVITALYVPMGAPPGGAEARLAYIAAHTTAWWAILGLSVLTDFLLVPIAWALYLALRRIDPYAMWFASAFVGLFVILDLALTWTNYAALIALSSAYAAATTDAQRTLVITAATYPTTVLSSNLLFVYNSLSLAVGILVTARVMMKGMFGRSTAYLGVVTGLLGILAVASSFFASSLSSIAIILTSVLTTVWYLFVGYRLVRQ